MASAPAVSKYGTRRAPVCRLTGSAAGSRAAGSRERACRPLQPGLRPPPAAPPRHPRGARSPLGPDGGPEQASGPLERRAVAWAAAGEGGVTALLCREVHAEDVRTQAREHLSQRARLEVGRDAREVAHAAVLVLSLVFLQLLLGERLHHPRGLHLACVRRPLWSAAAGTAGGSCGCGGRRLDRLPQPCRHLQLALFELGRRAAHGAGWTLVRRWRRCRAGGANQGTKSYTSILLLCPLLTLPPRSHVHGACV